MTAHKCTCDLCVKWSPLLERIEALLTPEDVALFDAWIEKCATENMDLGAAESMLAGDWPGWEWMKDARRERGLT